MSKVKSLSVGNGDMCYIQHVSSNFTIIDCCLSDDNKETIVNELIKESKGKIIQRFISTHPDEDHIRQLDYLNKEMPILNFYCVKNDATKKDETPGYKTYRALRDGDKAFYLFKGCSRKWMNESGPSADDTQIDSAGITILWPEINNEHYIEALKTAKEGGSPNNISPIIKYSIKNGATFLWMGDLETDFMTNIEDKLELPKVNILFAPHHGRDSGKVPQSMLNDLNPDIIVIGEAPSQELNYYKSYNTITQNTAGDITFVNNSDSIDIYVSKSEYQVGFLKNNNKQKLGDAYYLGTLHI